MTGRDFSKLKSRESVARRGYEPAKGGLPLDGAPRRSNTSRADLRNEANSLLDAATMITRVFRCMPCDLQFRAKQLIEPVESMACKRCGRPV
ncbi:hypothetical protein ELH53_15345 [Rhizobium ruizarguesonis]|uniref:hypothetical protein n=1 Tax=Rhizobium ruizarguesonis TaxID=2081791 RepID=UPI00102FFE4A|nr:hypothetical protein [Rhizobium ruizarguesonis]TBA86293.1 hypothetical protein ELH53_15345 [Rhizobium ruizarguesonis]